MRKIVVALAVSSLAACGPSFDHVDHPLDLAIALRRAGLCDEYLDVARVPGGIMLDREHNGGCDIDAGGANINLTRDGGSSLDYLRRIIGRNEEPMKGNPADNWFLLYDGNWWMSSDQRTYMEQAQEVVGGTLTTNRRIWLEAS
jgi:hypothetical protein